MELYKVLEEKVLFHSRLEKLKYEDGKLYLSMTPLVRRFVLLGDIVNIGYAGFVLPARVVGKNESLIVNPFYAGEGKLGDRTKPRAPVLEEYRFTVLIKMDGVLRAFEPFDVSEAGFSIISADPYIPAELIGKVVEFKFAGREELSGIFGKARLVGVLEDNPHTTRLAFEVEIDDASATQIRLYVIKVIQKLFST